MVYEKKIKDFMRWEEKYVINLMVFYNHLGKGLGKTEKDSKEDNQDIEYSMLQRIQSQKGACREVKEICYRKREHSWIQTEKYKHYRREKEK